MKRASPKGRFQKGGMFLALTLLISTQLHFGTIDAAVAPNPIERVSVSSSGGQATSDISEPAMSADGRYVVFSTKAPNLVPTDTNALWDIFVRDRTTGITEMVTLSSTGEPGNGDSSLPFISDDGRYVFFVSHSTNLVSDDTNNVMDAFVHDRQTHITQRASVTSSGAQIATSSGFFSMGNWASADGRYVVFLTTAPVVPEDTNLTQDLYIRDLVAGVTERVSVTDQGQVSWNSIGETVISADGRYVAFMGYAVGDPSTYRVIYVRDRMVETTKRIVFTNLTRLSSMTPDGTYLGISDYTTNQGLLFEWQTGTTEELSVSSSGEKANSGVSRVYLSADGRYATFTSDATNLVAGDTNSVNDVFVRDRVKGTTDRISLDHNGNQLPKLSVSYGISADARHVLFRSAADYIVPQDNNGVNDLYIVKLGQPPVITPPLDQNSQEGQAVAFELGSFTDDESDAPWSVEVNWDDSSAPDTYTLDQPGSLGPRAHSYGDNGTYTVTTTVTDGTNRTSSTTFTVTVSNVAPTITQTATLLVAKVNTPATVQVAFNDPGANEAHTAAVDWGDGAITTGSVLLVNGHLYAEGSHSYVTPGEYAIRITITDKDGGTVQSTSFPLIVY